MRVFCYDEFTPEDGAMMQALYSRSAASVEDHVEKVRKTGSGKFMESFYVGYGHNSIADCGSTTIYIEDVSIFVTKAFQAHNLYSGQETSTRYIDMGKQGLSDPVGAIKSREILDGWMEFYLGSGEELRDYIRRQYPRGVEEDEKVYERAVAARSFDILRGFLPAAVHTQFSWHTNLRQAHDALDILMHNPLAEVRETAAEVLRVLKEKYPHSFSHKLYPDSEKYREYVGKNYTYYHNAKTPKFKFSTSVKASDLVKYRDLFEGRPMKTLLPQFLLELGLLTFEFKLDFGSFRDLQRHRNGVCRMPLLTTELGFNDWYLAQLPDALRGKAEELIVAQKKKIALLEARPEDKQYYIAMGFNVSCKVSYGLPASAYTIELRSGSMVHPSLRRVAHMMSQAIEEKMPMVKLYTDYSVDSWDIRRGTQTIMGKKNG